MTSLQKQIEERARRRANDLAAMSDEQLAEAYVSVLSDRAHLHYAPYLITAVRETVGLWERLTRALAQRAAA